MKSLRRVTFEGYIYSRMMSYQEKNGTLYGFTFMRVPNRNKIVSEDLWKLVLLDYLKHLRDN
jgi:hypothetical protein